MNLVAVSQLKIVQYGQPSQRTTCLHSDRILCQVERRQPAPTAENVCRSVSDVGCIKCRDSRIQFRKLREICVGDWTTNDGKLVQPRQQRQTRADFLKWSRTVDEGSRPDNEWFYREFGGLFDVQIGVRGEN